MDVYLPERMATSSKSFTLSFWPTILSLIHKEKSFADSEFLSLHTISLTTAATRNCAIEFTIAIHYEN